jgi:hypothetical protein
MKLLLENWRKYLNEKLDPEIAEQIETYVELPVRRLYIYGPPTFLEESERGNCKVWAELNLDLDAETMSTLHEKWEHSEGFKKLQEMGYDVRLGAKNENVDEPNILLTRDLL